MSDEKVLKSLTFEEFPNTDASVWREKIVQDLKGKNWEDYFWEIEPGLVINPAQFDTEKVYQPLFSKQDSFWIGQEMEVGEKIAPADQIGGEVNQGLLKLLMLGVSAPKLHFSNSLTTSDWLALFDQVQLEYLNLQCVFANSSIAKSCLSSIPEQFKNIQGSVQITTQTSNSDQLALYQEFSKDFPGLRFFINSPETLGFVDQLAIGLERLYQYVELIDAKKISKAPEQFILAFNIGNELLAEIAKLRAARLLSELFFSQYGLSGKEVRYQVEFSSSALTGEPELDVIRLTTMALGANLGGADLMNFPLLGNQKKDFFQRITSNIQHLFELESHLGKVGDPLAGSHFIEALTEQMAAAAWKKFQDRL